MKTNFALTEKDELINFEKINTEEMNAISGGEEDVYIQYDPVTGNVNIVVKPRRL